MGDTTLFMACGLTLICVEYAEKHGVLPLMPSFIIAAIVFAALGRSAWAKRNGGP